MINNKTASMLGIKDTRLFGVLEKRKANGYISVIEGLGQKVTPLLNENSRVFATYTLHDVDHSIRIMEYMYDLIPDINKISDLDITILISSALLHDIGMRVGEEEEKEIRKGNVTYSDISFNAILRKENGNENEAVRSFVRRFHGNRSYDFVLEELQDLLVLPDLSAVKYVEEVAKICVGHTEDISWLTQNLMLYNTKGKENYSPLFCGVLLRLADILDIDSQRTPPFLYQKIAPTGISDTEWRKHFVIQNTDKIKTNDMGEKVITIIGECNSPDIHRELLNYLDMLNEEVDNVIQTSKLLPPNYKVNLKHPIIDSIEPKGYTISDMKLSIDFNAISNLLMGERIYGERKLGLRELIQNSIDACKVRLEIENRRKQYGRNSYKPTIEVILDSRENKFIIKDNGIGMSMEILNNFFLNIGVSYYKSDDFLLKEFDYTPIGNFGIGFLACFMMSKDVIIHTRYIEDSVRYMLSLTKNSPYICMNVEEDVQFLGTEIHLNYSEVIEVFGGNFAKVKAFLGANFITEELELMLFDSKAGKSEQIINHLMDYERNKKNESIFYVDVSEYMQGVEGFIELHVKRKKSFNSLEDIPFQGKAYLYDDGKLIEIEDEYNVWELYNEDTHLVPYISMPIVSEDYINQYNKILDVLEEHELAIEKLEEDSIDWITIFYNAKNVTPSNRYNTVIEEYDCILGDLYFEDIVELGQDNGAPTKLYHEKFNLFFSNDKRLFFPFKKNEGYKLFTNYERELYLRNTLVPEFKLKFAKTLSFLEIRSVKINVSNTDVVTDVSRNRLEIQSDQLINAALNKVICLWALDNAEMSDSEQEALKDYIELFHRGDNSLLKDGR